jgi:hypothetical protein
MSSTKSFVPISRFVNTFSVARVTPKPVIQRNEEDDIENGSQHDQAEEDHDQAEEEQVDELEVDGKRNFKAMIRATDLETEDIHAETPPPEQAWRVSATPESE